MSVPRAAASRHPSPVSLAATSDPPNFPVVATSIMRPHISHWSRPVNRSILVRIPASLLGPASQPTIPNFFDFRFRIPPEFIVENFQVSQTQGPPLAFIQGQTYFYHPIFDISMYSMPELDQLNVGMYQFIENQISQPNPALLPFLQDDEESKKKQNQV